MKNKIGDFIIGMIAILTPIVVLFGLILVLMRPILGYWPFFQNDPRIAQRQIEFTKLQTEYQNFKDVCNMSGGVPYGDLCLATSSIMIIEPPLTD